jgi:hypothetical protein
MAETHVSVKVGPSNEKVVFHNPDSGSGSNAVDQSNAKLISKSVRYANPA